MNIYQLPAFCREHGMSSLKSKTRMLSMKLMVDYFFSLPEIEEIMLRFEHDPDSGILAITEQFTPICCYLGEDIYTQAITEAQLCLLYGPRLQAPDSKVKPEQFDLN